MGFVDLGCGIGDLGLCIRCFGFVIFVASWVSNIGFGTLDFEIRGSRHQISGLGFKIWDLERSSGRTAGENSTGDLRFKILEFSWGVLGKPLKGFWENRPGWFNLRCT